jgi:hypothetical protein
MDPISFQRGPVIPIAQPFDLADYPELAGIEVISGTGLIARTGTGTYATRTLTAPAAGITIANAGGVAGNPTFSLANDLAALEALSSTGIAVRSNTDTWVQRTITGTSNQISVSNGDGVSGNPTLSTPQDIHTAATPQFAGIGLGTAYSSGRIQLVSGTTSADGVFWGTDTNLYRSAANMLTTDDSLTADGVIIRGNSYSLSNSWTIGPSASVTGINSMAMGSNTTAVGNSSIAIGRNASASIAGLALGVGAVAAAGTAIGVSTSAGSLGVTIGELCTHTVGTGGIAIGKGATAAGTAAIVLGVNNTAQANTLVIGGSGGFHITDSYIGSGATSTSPISHTLNATGGSGTDIAGANLTLAGGRPTGAGAGGYVAISTAVAGASGTGLRSLVERMRITSVGNLLIGTTTETASSGLIQLATGTTAASGILAGTDTNLYRSAANTWTTDDAFNIGVSIATAYDATTAPGFLEVRNTNNTATTLRSGIDLRVGGAVIAGGAVSAYLNAIRTASGASAFAISTRDAVAAAYAERMRIDSSALTVTPTTASTSSTTGALIVSGGVGIAKALYVASDLVVTPTASANRSVNITGSNGGNPTISVSAGSLAITPATVFASTITTIGGATFHTTSSALTDGAGVAAGTLTNAPAAGDPTKWIGINDNGTTRYIPAW